MSIFRIGYRSSLESAYEVPGSSRRLPDQLGLLDRRLSASYEFSVMGLSVVATEFRKVTSWSPNPNPNRHRRARPAAGCLFGRQCLPTDVDEDWHTCGIDSETVRDQIIVGTHLAQPQAYPIGPGEVIGVGRLHFP